MRFENRLELRSRFFAPATMIPRPTIAMGSGGGSGREVESEDRVTPPNFRPSRPASSITTCAFSPPMPNALTAARRGRRCKAAPATVRYAATTRTGRRCPVVVVIWCSNRNDGGICRRCIGDQDFDQSDQSRRFQRMTDIRLDAAEQQLMLRQSPFEKADTATDYRSVSSSVASPS